MLRIIGAIILAFVAYDVQGQTIVGTWQLVSQTDCLSEDEDDPEVQELIDNMKSQRSPTSHVIEFKSNNMGSESVRIMQTRKADKMSSFMYKLSDGMLYFLDKRSRLLISSFDVEKLTEDSLIISNAARACETRIFVRIK